MTKHPERLGCPRCDTPLLTYDGLGEVGEHRLATWRQALAAQRAGDLRSRST